MLQALKEHIEHNFPFLKEKKILVAVSGGIDSVVLVHALHQLNYTIALAHCNFKLRYEDSEKDEVFVRNLAEKLGIPFFVQSFQTKTYAATKGISIQMAARELRYNWFEEIQDVHQYNYVATAHHLNDNIETVLINLTRGCTLTGLLGIPAVNNTIIRPLLPFTRKQIQQYTITHTLSWREDESNASTKYYRNKIRHEVVPILEELNPNLLTTFEVNNTYLKNEYAVFIESIERVKRKIWNETTNEVEINIALLIQEPNYEVYLHYMLKPYGFSDWKAIQDLLHAKTGKLIKSSTYRLIKNRGVLLLSKNAIHLLGSNIEIRQEMGAIKEPIPIEFVEVSAVTNPSKTTLFIDTDKLTYPLRLRKKEEGDYFFPSGIKGKKKLSKYFKDEKLSLTEKEAVWVLCTAVNEVVWIVGMRGDKRFIVSPSTKNILKISLGE